jgi:hypothetical protein
MKMMRNGQCNIGAAVALAMLVRTSFNWHGF